jgi:hypothetical protein
MVFHTTEQITKRFIESGWNRNVSFKELSLNEAKRKGYLFAITGINKGRKYFIMSVCGNIYDDKGKLVMYNIPVCSK